MIAALDQNLERCDYRTQFLDDWGFCQA